MSHYKKKEGYPRWYGDLDTIKSLEWTIALRPSMLRLLDPKGSQGSLLVFAVGEASSKKGSDWFSMMQSSQQHKTKVCVLSVQHSSCCRVLFLKNSHPFKANLLCMAIIKSKRRDTYLVQPFVQKQKTFQGKKYWYVHQAHEES